MDYMIAIRNAITGLERSFPSLQHIADFLAGRDDAADWSGHENLGPLPAPTAAPEWPFPQQELAYELPAIPAETHAQPPADPVIEPIAAAIEPIAADDVVVVNDLWAAPAPDAADVIVGAGHAPVEPPEPETHEGA